MNTQPLISYDFWNALVWFVPLFVLLTLYLAHLWERGRKPPTLGKPVNDSRNSIQVFKRMYGLKDWK